MRSTSWWLVNLSNSHQPAGGSRWKRSGRSSVVSRGTSRACTHERRALLHAAPLLRGLVVREEEAIVTIKEIIEGGTEAAFVRDGMVAWASLDAFAPNTSLPLPLPSTAAWC